MNKYVYEIKPWDKPSIYASFGGVRRYMIENNWCHDTISDVMYKMKQHQDLGSYGVNGHEFICHEILYGSL